MEEVQMGHHYWNYATNRSSDARWTCGPWAVDGECRGAPADDKDKGRRLDVKCHPVED